MYKKMYAKKPKKVPDPLAPPRPTLLGQVKDLRLTKEESAVTKNIVQQQQHEIDYLKEKVGRLTQRLEQLTIFVKSMTKQQ
jgi:hypothetical protein